MLKLSEKTLNLSRLHIISYMAIKKVLITGASRGIGLAIANKLANQYELILHATNEQSFTRPIPNSSIISADFSDPEQVTAFCKRLKKEHGDELYAIINNAGVTLDNSIIFQSEKDIDKMLNVNLKAPIMICKTAMKIFNVRKKGVIINVGSVIGETGNAFQSIYAATKAGLVAFSKSLA
ncbi:MAG TPA: SDR family oxidoreductase, partial [Pedobacter sp.]|nr:SDR family oxidoreductase [Pedobacter sp.]